MTKTMLSDQDLARFRALIENFDEHMLIAVRATAHFAREFEDFWPGVVFNDNGNTLSPAALSKELESVSERLGELSNAVQNHNVSTGEV